MDENGFAGSSKVLTSRGNMYIKDLFEICDNHEHFYFNNKFFKGFVFVRSIYGHDDIAKVIYIGKKETIKLYFEDDFTLDVTPDYYLMTADKDEIRASESLSESIRCYFKGYDLFRDKKVKDIDYNGRVSIYNVVSQAYRWIVVNNVVVSTPLTFSDIDDELAPSVQGFDLKELILSGEGPRIEFKSSLRWDINKNEKNKALELQVAKTICGFANSKGGYLLIGVKDDGSILGLEDDFKTLGNKKNKDGFLLSLDNIIQNFLGDEIHALINISIENVKDKEICVLEVNKSQTPVYIKNHDFYIRRGSSTKNLNPKEAIKYTRSHFKD